jgi:D-alanyl-D-alanine carboxypeptidase
MMGLHRVVTLAAVVALSMSAACSRSDTYSQLDLQRDVDAIRNAGTVGVQARVTIDDDVLVAASGVADIESREPVPFNGHYRIASNTKTFVATVVLQLVGEGELSLDDSVDDHLPGVVRGNGHDGSVITIRDLLRHTSGIYSYDDDDDVEPWLTADVYRQRRFIHYEPEDLVAVAMRHPPNGEPGIHHDYSNTNYVLAGMVIEAATGNPWAREVEDRIIEPLGLMQTMVPDGPEMPEPHAKSYYQFEPRGPLVDTTLLDPSAGDAAGAIISTPEDMTRFFRALVSGELLAPELLAEMQDSVASGDDNRYGLGLAWSPLHCGGGYWRHGGAAPGYASAEGFSEDGSRSVVISKSSMHQDETPDRAQGQATGELIANVLCEDP